MTVRMQRGLASVRSFNAVISIGTRVWFRGQWYLTWSPEGLGRRDTPSVFLDGIDVPVPISCLRIPGFKLVYGRQPKGKDGSDA